MIIHIYKWHPKNWTFLLVCMVMAITSCSKKDKQPEDPFDPATAKIIRDEHYGTGETQTADIYLPANRGSATRTVVLIHGGFWTAGDKSDMDTLIQPIQGADPTLAIVNMNYTLADGSAAHMHPAQMHDIQLLLDHIDNQSANWHVGNHYALTGVSSGAHLALLYTYGYDTKKQVKAVASVLGPTNFADPYYINQPLFQSIISSFLGKTWLQDSNMHKAASPINMVTNSSMPTFMAYGNADPLIPMTNPEALLAKLQAFNVPYSYRIFPGESHELSDTAILLIISDLANFFRTYL